MSSSNKDNETVAEIAKRVRRECNSYPLPANAAEMLRIVREIAAAHERDLIKAIKPIEANYEHALYQIAELRECLREAVDYQCEKEKCEGCFYCEIDKRQECIAYKWRKALEGGNDED